MFIHKHGHNGHIQEMYQKVEKLQNDMIQKELSECTERK